MSAIIEIFELIMMSILLSVAPTEGSLSRYDPGVMDRVLEWRHTTGYPAGFDPYARPYDGYIAVADCDLVGKDAEVDGVCQSGIHWY